MVIVKDFDRSSFIDNTSTYRGNLQIGPNVRDSKTAGLFDYIYSYPPKIKLRWDSMDEFHGDLLLSKNYGVLEHSFPFIDFIQDWFFYNDGQEVEPDNYSVSDFVDGYLDKLNSSTFYKKHTKGIQSALAKIPIFVIINGHNEIVLSQTSNALQPKGITSLLNKIRYDTCGAFDPNVETRQQLGFFFMTRLDADNYLQEVAKSDIDGTKTVGLAVHCIGLDAAYRVTREYHPGIDFRFVPNYDEIKGLLQKDIFKKNFIVEDSQYQMRFRPRNQNLLPSLGKLGRLFSPSVSFLQRNEYFKGVPIYIVQISNEPKSYLVSQYFNLVSLLDSGIGNFVQALDNPIGFGHNWIMQGSLYDAEQSNKVSNYIFFERNEAKNFIKKQGLNVTRYSGSRTSNIELLVRKPKIFVYNLEDFLELWEEKIQSTMYPQSNQYRKNILEAESTSFLAPTYSKDDLVNIAENNRLRPFKKVKESLALKYRVFKNFVGIFFSVGYN